ncbi:MAG: PHP domain-containing protein [Sarcina sp.]
MYTSFHNHTDYSNSALGFTDSINKVEQLIQGAYDIGLMGVAITDHETISSHVQAEKYYKQMGKDRDFKLILGNEIYLQSEEEDEICRNWQDYKDQDIKRPKYHHFVINALDLEGHKMIRELSSRAWLRSYVAFGLKRRPTFYSDLEEVVGDNKGHIVGSTACLGGHLPELILNWINEGDKWKKEIHKFITWGISTFGKDYFYLEVQPCYKDNEEQCKVNEKLFMLSEIYGIGIISTSDAHYLSKDKSFTHTAFLNSKDGGDSRESDKFYATAYLHNEEEMYDELSNSLTQEQIEICFANTMKIHSMVQSYSLSHITKIPCIPLEHLPNFKISHKYKKFYTGRESIKHYALSGDIYQQYYWYEVEQGLEKKIMNKNFLNHEKYFDQINLEFEQVRGLGEIFNDEMCNYFTVVKKVIDIIWTKGDSLVGIARGSGGCYVTNYLLGITSVDPLLEYHEDMFPWWRFASTARSASLFDIDIDIISSKKEQIISAIKEVWGMRKVCQVATFSRLTSKTSIEKACKGLNIEDTVSAYLKSLIPVVRGKIYSLSDCFYGNEKKQRDKVPQLVAEVEKYPGLKETMFAIEGTIISQGVHAGAVNILKDDFTETGSYMTAGNGNNISSFDLHDAEYCGDLKLDLLSIDALQKIRKCMDLLIQKGHMEWQGNLRDTYNKYLSYEAIEKYDPKMWELLPNVYSAFQFDSPVGKQALNKVGIDDLISMTLTNGLLRLQASEKGGETPIDKYVRYRKDINEWYKDMTDYGLNQDEQNLLSEYLTKSSGLCVSQETTMQFVMDKRVAGMSLKEADLLRKGLAKGSEEALKNTEHTLYEKGLACGTSKTMLDYLWWVQIEMSKSYAFSSCHAMEYSIICCQELNLNYRYSNVYWNTACLCVEASADEDSTRKTNIDYGKMISAITGMRRQGINIVPPSINHSGYEFLPDEENNSILFSLKAIAGIGDEVVEEIIEGRPYSSFKHFYNYHKTKETTKVTRSKMIALIKSGCFDEFNTNRVDLMKWLAFYETEKKEKLNGQNLPKVISLGVEIDKELVRAYRFKQFVLSKENFYCKDPNFKSKNHYIVEPTFALPHLQKRYMDDLVENRDYYYDNENLIIIDKSLEKAMKSDLDALKQELTKQSVLDDFNKRLCQETYNSMVDNENINKWALETISYYDKEHELEKVDLSKYNISKFYSLNEEPSFELKRNRGREWRQYELSRIAGTVIDFNNDKSIVSLLTFDGVVNVRFYSGQFSHYKQSISDNGVVVDKPWIARGNILLVCGFRRGEEFVAKKYSNSAYQHSVAIVDHIDDNGQLDLRFERYKVEED